MWPSRGENPRSRPQFSRVRWRADTQEGALRQQDHAESEWASNVAYRGRFSLSSLHGGSLDERTARASSDSNLSRRPSPASLSGARQYRTTEEQGNPSGLTVLHEPEDVPIADLVFVHSPGGGSFGSWTSEEQDDVLWPLDWLPEEPLLGSMRISTYGYTSQISLADPGHLLDVTDFAKDLLAKLRFGHGQEGRPLNIGCAPLIFVAHSLGGFIAKKAYLLATSDPNSTYGGIAQATAAFIFFSTPHRNLESSVVNDILLACVVGWRPFQHTDLVKRHLSKLQDINDRFRDLATPLDIYSFYERPSVGSELLEGSLILPRDLVTLNHPSETQIPLNAEHTTISRLPSRAHTNYSSVRGAFRVLAEKFKNRRRSATVEDTAGQTEEVNQLLRGCGAPQDDLSFFSDKRIESSCEWVIMQPTMHAFLTDDGPYSQVLWCYGGPGSGKSVCATYITECLLEDSNACAYYYFRSGHHVKNNLGQFLMSVASQISQHIPEYRRNLCALGRDRFDVEKAGHKLLWKKLFVSALFPCKPRVPLFIVIDGLDELPQAKELLQKMLVELADASFPIKLLVVSRPTLDIETSIERLSKRISLQRMALDCNAEDLAMYVRDEMDVMVGDDDFKERTVKEILSKADGNFLWAHLVVQEILECQTEVQVEDALRQVPRELEPLYVQMDTRLADAFRSRPQDKEMGHTIIMWATCARRPLHIDEIKTALETDFPRILDMRQTVQRLCGEFVLVDKKGHVSMMHASAREFLMFNSWLNYYVSPLEANQKLFSRCLQALTPARRSSNDLDDRTRAFLEYCASSWPFHLARSSDYQDQDSLAMTVKFLGSRTVLDWMFMLARAGKLRVMAEASRALTKLLKMVNRADMDRSPLMHRLGDKEVVHLWAQDLIRIIGKFGQHISQHPAAVYNLMPIFCPRETIIHRQFATRGPTSTKGNSPLVVRGKASPTWDDCFAKFTVTGDALPHSILTLDRYFAILTKENGTVHLYYSATCETARRLQHREPVLTFCVDSAGTRIATYSLRKTIVWDIESGRLLCSIENPGYTKALTMSFQQVHGGPDFLITFSDDCNVRSCSLESMRLEWECNSAVLDPSPTQEQHQAKFPYNAQFSPDGRFLAISYRGAHPTVWSTATTRLRYIACCDHRARRTLGTAEQHSRNTYVRSFAWNPISGHLLGTYNDFMVFKWHPQENDFALSEFMGESIKCSTDGKLFVTGSYDGNLRIWDFEHFTPIYNLRYPLRVQDVDLGRNEARVYDIRDQYCNIWEPNSLLRAMESDDADVASDAQSNKDSDMPSHISEAVQEDFEPITAFAAMGQHPTYAIGDDAGVIKISNYDGETLVEIQESPMSVDKLAWCDDSHLLASFDLGHEIQIREVAPQSASYKTLRSFTEVEVSQLLFDTLGDLLMVTSSNAVKVYQVRSMAPPAVWPAVEMSKWVVHPQDGNFALGFTASKVILMPWARPVEIKTFTYDFTADRAEATSMKQRPVNPRWPSEGYPASPSEIDRTVHKVFTSPNATLAVVDIYSATKQTRRRSGCLLIATEHLLSDTAHDSVSVRSMSSHILDSMYISLGFIDADRLMKSDRAATLSKHTHWIPRRRHDSNTFVFIDKDFWICSVDIDITPEPSTKIRKHFFLPRDWQNAEWLDMAMLTTSGELLCPRNGDVTVVSNGFLDDFRGD